MEAPALSADEAPAAAEAAVDVHIKANGTEEDKAEDALNRKESDAVSALSSSTFFLVDVESGASSDSPSSSTVSSAGRGEKTLLKRLLNGFGGEAASSAPETLTPIESALHASPHNSASSAASYDSAPAATAVERRMSANPSVTMRRGEFNAETESDASTPRTEQTGEDGNKQKTTPVLERAHTSSELIGLRGREAPGGDKSNYSSPSSSAPSFEIESVLLPSDGIKELEIDRTMHTVFAIEVRLQGGLQWIIRKRYSDFRELHDRLKRTNASVKQLYFPKRHVFRNRHQSVIEQRRSELEKYINEVLDIRPLIRVPLFNFLEVYAHMESYERKLQRHKKELESERMKNLLEPGQLEDFTAAFKRLCSSKYLYHGNSKNDAHDSNHNSANSTPAAKQNGSQPTSPAKTNGLPPSGASAAGNTPAKATPESSGATSRNSIAHTEGSQICISRASFRRDILGVFPDMPSSFAMRFMKAVSDRQGSDINMDEFLRAVAILRRGTMEDRLQFVYNMCDLDHAGKVQSTGLSNFLVSLHGRHVLDRAEYRRLLSEGFDQGRLRMNSDEFVKVVNELGAYNMLVDWMDPFVDILCETADPDLLESQEEFNPAVQQKILASETRFSAKEVSILQDAFNNYRVSGGGDTVDVDALASDFPLEMSDERFLLVFSSFGARANGSDIDVFSFVNAIAIACRGTPEEKAKFAFTLFATVEGDTLMNRDDVYGMLRLDLAQNSDLENHVTAFMEKRPPTLATTKSTSSSSLIDMGARTPSVSGSELGIFVDAIMKGHGRKRSVSGSDAEMLTLSVDEFTEWCLKDKYEMSTLRIMREVAFIDLGLIPADKEEELAIAKGCYRAYDQSSLIEDEYWYLIDRKWFVHWCRYIKIRVNENLALPAPSNTNAGTVAGKPPAPNSNSKEPPMKDADGNYVRPKCITNYGLLTGDRRDRVLKCADDLKMGRHFVVICEQLWMALKLWYGGGPEIRRRVVATSSGEPKLDIWGDELKKQKKEEEEDEATTRTDEEKKKTNELALPRRMRAGGSVGLSNLGNTCYMNSALQCLTNTQLLAEYFLSGMYLDDINRTSTLGLQGKLAEVYGKLAEDMWCAKQKSISPRNFKKSIGKFNEVFRGSDQQDAQELLAFLLSGLSEDLNRIQDKPYIEQPDSDGRYDADLADEWWRNHLRREVSIIVALFTGQYKSLLTCSVCGFKSARFEPFTFLQVPLPEPTHSTVTVLLVLSNGITPRKVSVRLAISATIFDLKHELMKLCHADFELPQVSEADIKVCEYSGSMILSFKADNRRVGQIRSIDRLIAFQLEPLDADTIQATRHRRPSYIPGGPGAARVEEMENDRAHRFYEALKEGTLVEVRTRAQSHEYVPATVVDNPANRSDGDDQMQVVVRLRRTDDEVKVPITRIRPRQARLLYVPLLMRKLSYSAVYFKNPFRPVPFGMPNLVRICPERTSGLHLYRLVWERVRQYVPNAKAPEPWDEEQAAACSQVANHIDSVFCGLQSPCGFLLRRVESKGVTDSRASWLTRSFGYTIPCTSEPLDVMDEEAIAIDWDLQLFQDRDTLDKMKHVEAHASVAESEAIDKGPVPLRHCLDAFTSEEKISEGYCSSCRQHQEMTKKLEIWRLPPVMVIHLKRFQYTQTYRRKLGSLVEFPIEGLDLSSTVAPHVENPEKYPMKRPKASSIKEVDLSEVEEKPASVGSRTSESDKSPGAEAVISSQGHDEEDEDEEDEEEVVHQTEAEEEDGASEKQAGGDAPLSDGSGEEEQTASVDATPSEGKTVSISIDESKTSSVADENGDAVPPRSVVNRVRRGYTNTNLEQSRCLETNYDLYGVVNHQGALGGGHYTAYAKNFVDDQWYYYDDERVRVVEEQQVVSASAYLLFYVRSDMKGVLVKDMYPPNDKGKITEEDIDRIVEEGDDRRCQIM